MSQTALCFEGKQTIWSILSFRLFYLFYWADPRLLSGYGRWKANYTSFVDFHIETAVEGSQGQ